jgi:hypothetical protein
MATDFFGLDLSLAPGGVFVDESGVARGFGSGQNTSGSIFAGAGIQRATAFGGALGGTQPTSFFIPEVPTLVVPKIGQSIDLGSPLDFGGTLLGSSSPAPEKPSAPLSPSARQAAATVEATANRGDTLLGSFGKSILGGLKSFGGDLLKFGVQTAVGAAVQPLAQKIQTSVSRALGGNRTVAAQMPSQAAGSSPQSGLNVQSAGLVPFGGIGTMAGLLPGLARQGVQVVKQLGRSPLARGAAGGLVGGVAAGELVEALAAAGIDPSMYRVTPSGNIVQRQIVQKIGPDGDVDFWIKGVPDGFRVARSIKITRGRHHHHGHRHRPR